MKKNDDELVNDYTFFAQGDDGQFPRSPDVDVLAKSRMVAASSRLSRLIEKDLVRSPAQMMSLYLGLSLVGYALSLLICAQNTLGLSKFSHIISAGLHRLPDPWCPIVCGAVFTGIPFLLSCLFLTRFQHRYLIFRLWWFLAAIPLVTTGVMVFLPHGMQHAKLQQALQPVASRPDLLSDSAWISLWTASAILFPYLLELVVYLYVRPKRYRATPAASA